MKPLFISGIGTDIGKTVVSAILVERLKADYWKPIQSGDLDNSDTKKVRALVSNTISMFHQESYQLSQPFSPHKSAAIDGIEIDLKLISQPQTSKKLVIEGAGGLMVPLNKSQYIADLISHLDAEVILVVKHYLGSINHTLLSLELLKNRNIPLKGIIFNGETDSYSEQAILDHSKLSILGRVPMVNELNPEKIIELGKALNID
ncbi:dethiobiotin synthase [Pedobacter sp. P351]|uniref:dethiobiotin synthase n=1 Tax=Pedobacter superstes TaxID=3133441 RepID=UPI0030B11D09